MQINYPNNLSLRKVSLINPVSIEIQLDYLTVQIIPFSKKKKKRNYIHIQESQLTGCVYQMINQVV